MFNISNFKFLKKNISGITSGNKIRTKSLYKSSIKINDNEEGINFKDHYPVMWRKIMKILDENVMKDTAATKVFCDLTIGCGNHTKLILDKYPNVYMVGIDLDNKMIDYTCKKLKKYIDNGRLVLVEDNYVCIEDLKIHELFDHVDKSKFSALVKKKFDFMLLDLGFNSMQLEDMEKGISFKNLHSNLDMRYDINNDSKTKASEILNNCSELELMEIFHKFGDEKNYEKIARNIVKQRDKKRFETVEDFVKVINNSYASEDIYNIYTRLFQALRISVNFELVNIQRMLNKVFFNIELEGILAVISFHSIEDKIIKNVFKELENFKLGKNVLKKGERPCPIEIEENSRSRSSILRAFQFNPEKNK